MRKKTKRERFQIGFRERGIDYEEKERRRGQEGEDGGSELEGEERYKGGVMVTWRLKSETCVRNT